MEYNSFWRKIGLKNWMRIASYLGFISFVRLRCVCRRFRQIQIRRIPDALQNCRSIQLFGAHVEKLKVSCTHELPISVKHLILDPVTYVDLDHLTNLETLSIRHSNTSILSLPESLVEIHTHLPIPNFHLPNLRKLTMWGRGLRVHRTAITRLDIQVLPDALPSTLEELVLNYFDDQDFTQFPMLRSVVIKNAKHKSGAVLRFPPLKKLMIHVQDVQVDFDTTQLEHLEMSECMHSHLLVPSIKKLVILPPSAVDLFRFPQIRYYAGAMLGKRVPPTLEKLITYTIPNDLSYTKLKRLSYVEVANPRVWVHFPPTLKDLLSPQDVYFHVDTLRTSRKIKMPATLKQLELRDYKWRIPHLPELRKLILLGKIPPNVPSVDSLVLIDVTNANLSGIRVRKLKIVNSSIKQFPQGVEIFKFRNSTFPDARGLDLIV